MPLRLWARAPETTISLEAAIRELVYEWLPLAPEAASDRPLSCPRGGRRPPEPPPATGISELVLEVSDLDAARAFYRDVLGFEETLYGEGREGRYWYLVGETARLGLWTPQTGLAGGRGGAHVHFAFHVPEDDAR